MSQTRLQIPDHVKPYLEAEYCDDFPIERYYVSSLQSEILQDVLKAQKVNKRMQELGLYYLNATLLYGVPGTGKTTFGRYMSYYFDMDYVYINFAKLYNGVLGSTAGRISDIFRYISDTEAIFMLDEIDAISQKRGTESEVTGGEIGRITITIMQELDIMKRKKVDAIILGCTNRIDIMDPALKDRFSIKKEVKALNNREKVEYITQFLDHTGIPYDAKNIEDYAYSNTTLSNRSIDADINRGAVRWVENGEKGCLYLEHIRENVS